MEMRPNRQKAETTKGETTHPIWWLNTRVVQNTNTDNKNVFEQ